MTHPDLTGVRADEFQCRQEYWEEQKYTEPREQCKVCRWEGHDYEGEPCYHCKRYWEMPKTLKACEGWEPTNFEWMWK
jgi:hypothetical protein